MELGYEKNLLGRFLFNKIRNDNIQGNEIVFEETIEGISDKEYQKRGWIRGEGLEVDDFDETTCNFFQDGNGVIQNYKDFGLTDKQHQKR